MPDQKKSLSTSNSRSKQYKFLIAALLFFIPIVILYGILESTVRSLPTHFSLIQHYIEENGKDIEIAIFGSSQVQHAVNPEYLSTKSINLSSSGQHHNTDFTLLKGLIDRFPNLKGVVFEASYGHFEIPHNSKYYWKNSVFLHYYNVNTFQRKTYPQDKLLFISHPGKFSEALANHFLRDSLPDVYNKYGFDTNQYEGKYRKLKYDSLRVENASVRINNRPETQVLNYNAPYFEEMVAYCRERDLTVFIISPPTYRTYVAARNPDILKRRDSILSKIKNSYDNVYFLNAEQDHDFKLRYFRNENHLNPDGAEVFSKKLDSLFLQTEM
ncbi:hypothetical protein [Luteirhabdus pelagi]|uniref:hypothetical protein n=1 Tax=Luteirhabdus pelagi TaxID=2792783 RepID=UPI001939E353|nr:hypothetical protein [Luteirhabdus pelagi]